MAATITIVGETNFDQLFDALAITGIANNGGLIEVTTSTHGLVTGQKVSIFGATGAVAANINNYVSNIVTALGHTWTITVISPTKFTLQGSTYAAWSSDGMVAPPGVSAWTGGARTGLDAYNLKGGTFTVDTDTRYCPNSSPTKGAIGSGAIDYGMGGTLLLDGTKIRLLAFDGGVAGQSVPAIGATITFSGGATGVFLGVWATFTSYISAGTGMNTLNSNAGTGYLKFKFLTGSSVADNETISAGGNVIATANGADRVGWVEIIGAEGGGFTPANAGWIRSTGAWFEAGVTNGNAGQQIQLPATLATTIYAGVWIETSVAGVYEEYPFMGTLTGANIAPTDAARGKVCWISTQGLLTIGGDGLGNVNGYTPPYGRKVRVPNVLLMHAPSAALNTNSFAANLINRFFSGYDCVQGNFDFSITNFGWAPNFMSAYGVSFSDCAVVDLLDCRGVAVLTLDHTIVSAYVSVPSNQCYLQTCADGSISDSVIVGYKDGDVYALSAVDSGLSSIMRTRVFFQRDRTSGSSLAFSITGGSNLEITDCSAMKMYLSRSLNVEISGFTYFDRLVGNTTNTLGCYAIVLDTGCREVTISDLKFPSGIGDVQPLYGLIAPAGGCGNIRIRNIGTLESPLNIGSTYPTQYVVRLAYGSFNDGLKVQNVYTTPPSIATFYGGSASRYNVIENVGSGYSGSLGGLSSKAGILRGIGCKFEDGMQSVGLSTQWISHFLSPVVGQLRWAACLPAINDPISALTGSTCKYTGADALYAPNPTDSAILTCPFLIKGMTGFANPWSLAFIKIVGGGTGYTSGATVSFSGGGGTGAAATAVVLDGSIQAIYITNPGTGYTSAPTVTITAVGAGSGANVTAYLAGSPIIYYIYAEYWRVECSIDRNDGAGWREWGNCFLTLGASGGASGQAVMQLPSAAGVKVGDTAFSLNSDFAPSGSTVIAVDTTSNPNTVTIDRNLAGNASGPVAFSSLPAEQISATGFYLRLRLTRPMISIGYYDYVKTLYIPTTTTLAAQRDNTYPLDTANVTFTGLVAGTEIHAYVGTDPATAVEVAGIESSGTSFTFSQSNAGSAGYVTIIKPGKRWLKIPITYSDSDVSIPIFQVEDRGYNNPA
jgi:hypothetical protein